MKTLRFFLTLRLLFVQGWRSGNTADGSPAVRLGIEGPIHVWSAMQPSNAAPLRFGGSIPIQEGSPFRGRTRYKVREVRLTQGSFRTWLIASVAG